MIRYPVSLNSLETQVGDKWLKKAKARTVKLRELGKFKELSSIWSEIKPVYMSLQGNSKCAFCERKLESIEFGRGEQAVEHFRPKGDVKTWPVPTELATLGITFTTVAADNAKGYHLLAYHLWNYSASCIPCNSGLKGNYFPVAGTLNLEGDDPVTLSGEKAYLIYPIGDIDDDPEELIGFNGVSPFAKEPGGFARDRALVTINFFRLNDAIGRKNLIRERAAIIITLHPQLEALEDAGATPGRKVVAKAIIDGFTKPISSHTNCARNYVSLFIANRSAADEFFSNSVDLMNSIS